jgi:LPXTG-motif cell wall-anchored protein
MSRWTFPHKTGAVMALVAFVLGITAANAPAWPNEQDTDQPPAPKHGDKDKDKGKGHKDDDDDDDDEGRGGEQKPKPEKPETPPAVQPPGPSGAVTQPPPQVPVTSQGAPPPPAPAPPVETEALPPEQGGVPESPVVAQAPPEKAEVGAEPAAQREELAKTGLDPALIGLLGALFLGAGGLLFRRALARN